MFFDLPPAAAPADLAALLPAGLGAPLVTAAATAWAHAPFLKGLIRGRGPVLAVLAAQGPEAAFSAAMAHAADPVTDVKERLRQARGAVALTAALADLAGLWSLERVTAALSDFADASIDIAIGAALAERGAPNRGLTALALGKLGSHELNYSSDVDLIFVHDPDLIPRRPHEEPGEAAVRIAKRAVALLADLTADGYVHRVDLRLRPASEITPITIPVAAAEHYYQSEALTWERVAFIRARACAGDLALGQGLLDRIRPFVWRRSLDWTAVRDIQAVSLRIRDHFEAGQAIGPGYDLKRGRGGIREIEFFTQIHQLIWGGRTLALRAPATLDGLAALAAADRIDAGEAATLASSYRALRTLEHRLQMRRDEQTHMVPKLAADRVAVAALSGARDWATLQRGLVAATVPVATAYDRLIAAAVPETTSIPADAAPWLKQNHPKIARFILPLIVRWRTANLRALRSEAARIAFEAVLPDLIAGIAAAAEPAVAATRLDTFLAALPQGAQFFALLHANPRLIALLGHLLGVAPVLADALAREPALFDVMLAPDAFDMLPNPGALTAELTAFIGPAPDLEDLLDRVRRWTGERRFQLGAQLIEGRTDPLVAGRSLSDLADAALAVVIPAVAADFARSHGTIQGGEPVVLALGRYGGRALTHASDLDLIYLFTGSHEAISDGPRPLAATLYFNRLAARLTAALSVPTAAGALYEVDTRLRPWGAKGMLALSVDSFARYQADDADNWEHMALTRARVVGDCPAADAAVAATLARPRDPETLRRAVLEMRADIARAKPAKGQFDVKLSPGGLVDLEFTVHFLQLSEQIGLGPDLGQAIDMLTAAGHLPPGLATAHDLLTRFLVLLRLVAAGTQCPASFTPAIEAVLARGLGAASFAEATEQLALAKTAIRQAFNDTLAAKRT
ncbi:glutamate-ammonia-ligase adenylyltransferase [Polymorphobacter glacialis]|uniref:Glutamate-ammonia-ligase adenylyltransferase n=1 Tax=Sandarakinorhabdus glacialis TaxID=1614636 RepID=A0A917EBY4_9SPHN|nr:bifunctional [glutamate--ammonia ligase]-adenylyl-L-tyrosine phosphorylase/[glutamate--ammonia-ligase] adenylyltransferase [Polymorphobacter glacialis]GGE21043.1 glutamate-ammonia-ligase adenylyltransferase [Polymorphobacter glacialis]